MSTELLQKFAEELKNSRESKEITLQQISNKTRINIKFLQAIEEANFDVIDEVYVRAFLKEYAQMIDLDGVEVLAKYDKCKAGIIDQPEVIQEAEPEVEEEKPEPPKVETKKTKAAKTEIPKPTKKEEKTKPSEAERPHKVDKKEMKVIDDNAPSAQAQKNDDSNQVNEFFDKLKSMKGNVPFIATVASVVLILIIIIYFAFIKESKPQIIAERPFNEVVTEKVAKYETEPAVENTKPTMVDSLTLQISASDTSWVRVVMDEFNVEEFILLPNLNKTLRAERDFNILIGNAGGIKLFLNGNNLNFIGKSGGVRNVIVDKNGLRPASAGESAADE